VRRVTGALVVALTIGVIAACGSDGGGANSATTEDGSRPLATPVPDRHQGALPDQVRDIAEGRLPAGRSYRTRRLPIRVAVTPSDQFFGVDARGFFALTTDASDPPNRPGIVFATASKLLTFDEPMIDNEEFQAHFQQHLQPVPKDVALWIDEYPRLNAVAAGTAELGGRTARVFDFSIGALPDRPGFCADPNCVMLFAVPEIEVVHLLPAEFVGRIYVIAAGDDTILVVAGAPSAEWNRFRPVVVETLESLEIG
jgi:hypothetical protein